MADVAKSNFEALAARLEEVEGYLRLDEKKNKIAELEARSAEPGFWDDAESARAVMGQLSSARDDVSGMEAAREKLDDAIAAYELGNETGDGDLLAESAELASSLEQDLSELELSSWFTDELDHGDAIVTITPGQGGLEAQDWCEMLFRMYQRYCDRRGWKVTVNDAVPGEAIGLDRATFTVSGKNAYGMLARSRASTASFASRPPTRRSAVRPPSLALRCFPSCLMTSRSRLTPTTCALTYTTRPAMEARASTPPTRPCASRTSPRASWSPARTSAASSRTRLLP